MDRPGVQRAIAMVESGQADGIVCAYLDRWARNLEALEMIEQWTQRDKTFISAHERFDPTTSQGKFALGMMLLVAKYYRDSISERWDESARSAIERGVHVTVPYGYRRGNGRGSPLVANPNEATIVRRIFGERLRGMGIADIAAGLNADGIASPKGGRWTRQTVRALIRVRAYSGVASRGAYETAGAHDAIIEQADWDAAQTERARAWPTGNSLLTGLVRCAGCGYVMGASSSAHGGRRYNCNRHHAALDCPSPTTGPADRLERLVADEFLACYGGVSLRGASAVDPLVAETEAVLEAARSEFATWRDDAGMRAAIGDADYRSGLLARRQAVADAERAYDDAIRRAGSAALSVDGDVWSSLDTAERRELMRAGIDAVVLRRASSTHTPLPDRVEILWTGELDHDGSRAGIAAAVRGRP